VLSVGAPVFVNFNATDTAAEGTRVCAAGSNPEDGSDSRQFGGWVGFCVEKGNYGASGESGRPITASIGHESNVQSTAPLPNQAAPLLPA